MVAVIILMSDYQQFSSSFYKDQNLTIPSNYIFDDVYKSASDKYKYSKNPKYTYYNTLLTLKQKLSQNQSGVYNNVFNNNSKPKIQHVHPSPQKKSFMPIYHVEKINKMKFKVYKQGVGSQYVEKLPVTDLSFQIRMRGEEGLSIKPRLQEILSEYRKMNGSGRHSQAKQDIGKYGNNSDYNVRMMNKTMNKINRSMSHRK